MQQSLKWSSCSVICLVLFLLSKGKRLLLLFVNLNKHKKEKGNTILLAGMPIQATPFLHPLFQRMDGCMEKGEAEAPFSI